MTRSLIEQFADDYEAAGYELDQFDIDTMRVVKLDAGVWGVMQESEDGEYFTVTKFLKKDWSASPALYRDYMDAVEAFLEMCR